MQLRSHICGHLFLQLVLALTIGILFGIYSSVFVAAAIAMWLGIQREDMVKGGGPKKDMDPNDPNAPKELFTLPIPDRINIQR